MQQLKLFKEKQKVVHGGSLVQGKRISKRPLSTKRPIHLVLKAKPEFDLRCNKDIIKYLSEKYADHNRIQVYSMSVQKDHVHYCLRISCEKSYRGFVRSLTGMISRKLGKGIWKYRPYTRVGSWGRDFKGIKNYILQNELEALGVLPYKPRRR